MFRLFLSIGAMTAVYFILKYVFEVQLNIRTFSVVLLVPILLFILNKIYMGK